MSVLLAVGEDGPAGVLADQLASRLEIIGSVQVQGGDALQIALGQPGEGAGGGDLDHRRHALLPHHRSEEHTSELQSRGHLVCRLLLEKKKHNTENNNMFSMTR